MAKFSRNRKKNTWLLRKIKQIKRRRNTQVFKHKPFSWKPWKPNSKYHWIYNQKPIHPKKDNQKIIHGACLGGGRHFCTNCNHSQEDNMTTKCSYCGSTKILRLSTKARVPRKSANKQKWKNFRKHFIEPYLHIFED